VNLVNAALNQASSVEKGGFGFNIEV